VWAFTQERIKNTFANLLSFFSFFALSSHVDTPTKPNFSDTFGID
jgi:hypothetical protein